MNQTSPDTLPPAQQEKREHILQATKHLLAKCGFHGFSIKQVAAGAGVATGTVYLYFRDRQDLIQQLHMAIIEDIAEASFTQWNEQAAPAERYRTLCQQLWHYCMEHSDTLLCKGQFDQLPPDILRIQYIEAQSLFQPLKSLFEEGRQSGELAKLPDEALFCISLDSIWQLARRQMLGLVTVDDAMLAKVIDGTWRGILNPDH